MNYLKNIPRNCFSALTRQISVGRMIYGFCLGLIWGMGNVFNEWIGEKLWPSRDPFWQIRLDVLRKMDERLMAIVPDDLPAEKVFSEDELKEENEYYPEGETSDAMTEKEEEEEYVSKLEYLMEVEKCNRQIKGIIKKAKEDGKLPS